MMGKTSLKNVGLAADLAELASSAMAMDAALKSNTEAKEALMTCRIEFI